MNDLSEGELFLHFEQLSVLALDLVCYTQKRRATKPDFKLQWLARALIRRCRQKRFELSKADVRWVMLRAAEQLSA
ncbi:hypothetical protein [Kinneretia aquatilis]|uniref:hypothetical protein n=1 Tax=Kinneretia aquatilis TaxID=2070761 RepID=UPI0014952A7F|nr:hypothetical protein [Paucibacter aquatile]WIV99679.1 hypothetical protein K9V56_009500 [Paucibacter aquatile]